MTDILKKAATTVDPAQRKQLYAQANDLIKQHVPMVPVAHGGSATAFKADVKGAHSSPLTNEAFAVMDPGGRKQLVWIQNGEPGGIYCADETDGESLRVCEQIGEALLSYKIGGTDVEAGLAALPKSNADLTEWTFTLRDGAKFSDGTAGDRQGCGGHLRSPVGRQESAAQGPHRRLHLLPGVVRGLPEHAVVAFPASSRQPREGWRERRSIHGVFVRRVAFRKNPIVKSKKTS